MKNTMMMEQEEHLTEESQPKFYTRSTARHLRRKRLHDARRAEKQQEHLTNGINETSAQETVTEKNSNNLDQPEVASKSKARRLRKTNRAKWLQNFCSFCKSYCTNSSPVIKPITNQEISVEKDTEDASTITKSKARRLRKKNKTKLVQRACSFCFNSYPSSIDPILLKTTKDYDSNCCAKIEAGIVNNLKQNYNSENAAVETLEVCHLQFEPKPDSIESDGHWTDFFYRSRQPGPLQFEDEVEDEDAVEDYMVQYVDKGPCNPLFELFATVEQRAVATFRRSMIRTKQLGVVNIESEDSIIDNNISSDKPESPFQNTDRIAELDTVSSEIPSSIENTQPEKSVVTSINMTNSKGAVPEKSREDIKAERQAKKAAKALAKGKGKLGKKEDKDKDKDAPKSAPFDTKIKETNETAEPVPKENIEPPNEVPEISKPANTVPKRSAPEVTVEGKSKAELRAERRAKQEAQRAAKQQLLSEKSKVKTKQTDSDSKTVTQTVVATETVKKVSTPKKVVQKNKDNSHEINLFKHLYHEREQAIVDVPSVNLNIHPAIVRLGTQYESKVIVGSNARCVALLAAVKQLIQDFERPSQADFIRGLEASLQESLAYLHHCRPLAVSMQNALRHLKWQMTQLSSALSDADAKSKLISAIDTYILEQIQLADKAISITIQTKISNGDVILTYGYSSLINKILLDAHAAGKQFRVVIVDGRPWLEGKEQLRRLARNGIECSYILINALSYIMPEVSKVFLGAHAILANGAVMSRVGTAQVALMAKAFNIPVLVACETHKSCERVQTDSIVYNELGNANDLVEDYRNDTKKSLLVNWKTRKSLNLLNLTYDVTPADLVTAVVTELAILPCTSVPVILRIKPSEI